MKHIVVPVGFEAKLFAAEPRDRQADRMTWDDRGRLWVAETVDYPTSCSRRARDATASSICEDTDGDGQADKFTRLRRQAEHPHEPLLANGGLIVAPGPGHAVPQGHRRRRQGRRAQGPLHRLGHRRHPRRAEQPALRPRQLDLRHRRLRRLQRRRSAASGTASARGSSASSRTARSSNSSAARTTTPGASASARRACSSARPPTAARASTCRSRTATTNRSRGWSSTVLQNIADCNRFYPITDKVRQVDWHGGFTAGGRPRALHGPHVPEGILEPHGLRRRADRPPRRDVRARSRTAPTSTRTTPGTCSPATTNGPRRSLAEVGPDGHVWVIDWYNFIVQHNPTPQGFKTGKGNAYETPLRDKTHGRIYRIVAKDGKPSDAAEALEGRRRRSWSRR